MSTRPPQPATISAAPRKNVARSDGEAKTTADGHRDEGMAHPDCTRCATSRQALKILNSWDRTVHPTAIP